MKITIARIPRGDEKYEEVHTLDIVPSVAVERSVRHVYKVRIVHARGIDDIYVDNILVEPTKITRLAISNMFRQPYMQVLLQDAEAWVEVEERGFVGKIITLIVQ